MTEALDRPWVRRTGLALVVLLVAVRLIHLEADFPTSVSDSGMLYTDEGWWSNGAVARHLTGSWHVDGDYNPIVSMPVFTVVQGATFALLGMSLATARLTAVLFFLLMVALAWVLIRRYADAPTAWLVTVLLVTDWAFFAFSRVALLEIPMVALALAAIVAAAWTEKRHPLWAPALVAPLLALAVLTKTTAVFAVPVCMGLVWLGQSTLKARVTAVVGLLASLGVILLAHNGIMGRLYAGDLDFVTGQNMRWKLVEVEYTPATIAMRYARAIYRTFKIDLLVYPLVCVTATWLFLRVGSFRRSRLVQLCAVWIAVYAGVLSMTQYHPVRYMLPFIVPILILAGVAAVTLWRAGRPVTRVLVAIFLAAAVLVHGVGMARYLMSAPHTFVEMARDVGERMRATGEDDPVLLGHLANQVSLVAGVRSINDQMGDRSLEWKLRTYRPSWYVSLGIEEEELEVIAATCDVEQVALYDVYGNYDHGQQVHLYRLRQRDADADGASNASLP